MGERKATLSCYGKKKKAEFAFLEDNSSGLGRPHIQKTAGGGEKGGGKAPQAVRPGKREKKQKTASVKVQEGDESNQSKIFVSGGCL